jgi:hypothetical protein
VGSRLSIAICFGMFLLLSVIIFTVREGYVLYGYILNTFEATIFIAVSVLYFLKLVREVNVPALKDFYFAWINSAVLIYFSMAFFLFLFDLYIVNHSLQTFNNLYSLHWLVNIAYNILLALGVWKYNRK